MPDADADARAYLIKKKINAVIYERGGVGWLPDPVIISELVSSPSCPYMLEEVRAVLDQMHRDGAFGQWWLEP